MRPYKQLTLALLTLLGAALAACQPGAVLSPTSTPTVAPTVKPTATPLPDLTPTAFIPPNPSDIKPPAAALWIGEQSQVAGVGTYCWRDPNAGVGLCADTVGIPTAPDPLRVPASPFTARFELPLAETPSELTFRVMLAEDEMEVDGELRWWPFLSGADYDLPLSPNPEIELTLDPGLYVLNLGVWWDGHGDVAYGFLIEVEATATP